MAREIAGSRLDPSTVERMPGRKVKQRRKRKKGEGGSVELEVIFDLADSSVQTEISN